MPNPVSSASVSYQLRHRTQYSYSEPVAICQNQIRMIPRAIDQPTCQVRCDRVDAKIDPKPDFVADHVDYFGNQVRSFSIERAHRRLIVDVFSHVSVTCRKPAAQTDVAWEQIRDDVRQRRDDQWLTVYEFCCDSPRIEANREFAEYGRHAFPPGGGLISALRALTAQIHRDFRYLAGVTHVNTKTEEAFRLRAGVCQDFAHVQIACLRSLGLPARYVSGYLRTEPPPGKPRLIGADESHAWVSVYAGSELGWLDFDPTNDSQVFTDHIPLGIGRDYGDVAPMRGVVTGGGRTSLVVNVDVIAATEEKK